MHMNILLNNQTQNDLTQRFKKSRHFLAFMCCLGSNSCLQLDFIGAMILSLESGLSRKSCFKIISTNCPSIFTSTTMQIHSLTKTSTTTNYSKCGLFSIVLLNIVRQNGDPKGTYLWMRQDYI